MSKCLVEEDAPWKTGKSKGGWEGKGDGQARMPLRQCPAEECGNVSQASSNVYF